MSLVTLIALLAAGIAWLIHRTRPLPAAARQLRRRFPSARVRRQNESLELCTPDAKVQVPIAFIRALSQTSDSDPHTYRILAEIERAFARVPLGETELDALIPVPLPPERTERQDSCARFTISLHSDLDVAFALRSANSGLWLTQQDVEDRSVVATDLLKSALTALHQRTDGATIYRDGPIGSELYLIRQRDGLDASRLLLAPLWQRISKATDAPLVIAAPNRDRIYAAPVDQPRSVERLIERVSEDWSTRAHPITTRLWVWRSSRLEPWHFHA